MKICWDNLEKIWISKRGNFRVLGTSHTWYYFEKCKTCGEDYLGLDSSEFCSNECKNTGKHHPLFNKIGENSPRFGKRHTEEAKRKNSESQRGERGNQFGKYRESAANWKGGSLNAWFDTFIDRIKFCEDTRKTVEGYLEVRCKYCNKWYAPKRRSVDARVKCIEDKRKGEGLFYCSSECKKACPIYGQIKYPKGFIGDQNGPREVQPQLRKLVFERDDYTCQKCGLSSNTSCVELHCHHIDPVILNPIESADVDNCITLCKDCHQEAHQKDGCKTGQLSSC